MLAHFLKYDSVQENMQAYREWTKNPLRLTKEYSDLPQATLAAFLGSLGIDVVLECTGFYTSKEKAQYISTPEQRSAYFAPAGNDQPTIVYA